MNRAQAHFYDNYINVERPWHRHVILKSRQLGFTTFIDLFILDSILFNSNREGIIIAHKVQDATEIFDKKIEFALRNMAEDVKDALRLTIAPRKVQVVIDYGPEQGSTSSLAVSVSWPVLVLIIMFTYPSSLKCAWLFLNGRRKLNVVLSRRCHLMGLFLSRVRQEGMAGRFYEIFQQNWLTRDKISPQLSQVQFIPHFYNWQYDDMEMKKIYEPVPVKDMDICEIDWASYQQEHNLTDKEITYYYMKWLQFGGKNSPDAIKSLMQEYPTTQEEAFLSTGQTYFSTAKVAALLQVAEKGMRGEPNYGG